MDIYFSSLISSIYFQIALLTTGSTPAVNSSNNNIFGSPAKQHAKHKRLIIPPLNSLAFLFTASPVKPTDVRRSLAIY